MKVLEDIGKGGYERTMVREKIKKTDDAAGDMAVARESLSIISSHVLLYCQTLLFLYHMLL